MQKRVAMKKITQAEFYQLVIDNVPLGARLKD
jgi:hypothetical protein